MLFWQDGALNYFRNWFTYSTHVVNLGSWVAHIPGWRSGHSSTIPQPWLWILPCYVYAFYGVTLLSGWLMRLAKKRWPQVRRAKGFGFLATAFVKLPSGGSAWRGRGR